MDLEHQHQRLHHIWSIGDATHLSYSLPPANEVWGKVMFLHLFVSLFTGEGVGFPACITGDMTRGVCIGGGVAGGFPASNTCHMTEGVSIQGRWVDPHPKIHGIRSTSGRYAFYWNAFLFGLLRNLSYLIRGISLTTSQYWRWRSV